MNRSCSPPCFLQLPVTRLSLRCLSVRIEPQSRTPAGSDASQRTPALRRVLGRVGARPHRRRAMGAVRSIPRGRSRKAH